MVLNRFAQLALYLSFFSYAAQAELALEAGAAVSLPYRSPDAPVPLHALAGVSLSLPHQLELALGYLYSKYKITSGGSSYLEWDLIPAVRYPVDLLPTLTLTPAIGLAYEHLNYRGDRLSQTTLVLSGRLNIGSLFGEISWRYKSYDLPLSLAVGWQLKL